jgi:DNA replication protein DnaC
MNAHSACDVNRYSTEYRGHRILTSPCRYDTLGYHVAIDADGYEYIVGSTVVPQRTKDCPGEMRVWAHGKETVWTLKDGQCVPILAASAHIASQAPANLGKGDWSGMDYGQGRGMALMMAKAWTPNYLAGADKRGLWLYGKPGRGKSRLALCIMADLAAAGVRPLRRPWTDAASGTGLVQLMQLSHNGLQDVADKARAELQEFVGAQVKVIDDFGKGARTGEGLAFTGPQTDLMYAILEHALSSGSTLIATSNLHPLDFVRVDGCGAIASRMSEACAVLELTGPDYRHAAVPSL